MASLTMQGDRRQVAKKITKIYYIRCPYVMLEVEYFWNAGKKQWILRHSFLKVNEVKLFSGLFYIVKRKQYWFQMLRSQFKKIL